MTRTGGSSPSNHRKRYIWTKCQISVTDCHRPERRTRGCGRTQGRGDLPVCPVGLVRPVIPVAKALLCGVSHDHEEFIVSLDYKPFAIMKFRHICSRERGEARGRAEGEAEMLLRILAARGFTVTDDVRERVRSCGDTAQLEAWGDLAATAETLKEIFGD